MKGLYIVATPIGNLEEISKRALDVLGGVDYIACEDTRHSGSMLGKLGISKPLIRHESHNEAASLDRLTALLREGAAVALISDAGMPLISDPGARIVSACIAESIPYTVISGPCACINALVLSGMDIRSFCMLGFLPEKNTDRDSYIDKFVSLQSTLVLYCPPHDLDRYLEYLFIKLGGRRIAIVREMTKLYEEVIHAKLGDKIEVTRKGEFVLVIEAAKPSNNEMLVLTIQEHVEILQKAGLSKNDAIKQTARERGVHKSVIYKEVAGAGSDIIVAND